MKHVSGSSNKQYSFGLFWIWVIVNYEFIILVSFHPQPEGSNPLFLGDETITIFLLLLF